MKIKICVPAYNSIGSLRPILKKLKHSKVHQFTDFSVYYGVFPDNSRNEAICESNLMFPKLPDVDGFLTLDTDMNPSESEIYSLLEYGEREDVDIVANVYQKNSPKKEYCVSINGITIEPEKTHGFIEVKMVGFGCAFIKRKVLETIPKPWFNTMWMQNPDTKQFRLIHEDFIFCKKAIEAGFKVWCDFNTEVWHNRRDRDKLIKECSI